MTDIAITVELDDGDDVEGCYVVATAKAKGSPRVWKVIEHLEDHERGDHVVVVGEVVDDVWTGKIHRVRSLDGSCGPVRDFAVRPHVFGGRTLS